MGRWVDEWVDGWMDEWMVNLDLPFTSSVFLNKPLNLSKLHLQNWAYEHVMYSFLKWPGGCGPERRQVQAEVLVLTDTRDGARRPRTSWGRERQKAETGVRGTVGPQPLLGFL